MIDQLNQFEHAKLISKLLEFPKKEFYVAGMVAILLHEKELDLGKWKYLYETAKNDRKLKKDQKVAAHLQTSLKNEVGERKLDRVREEAKRMYHEHNPKPQPNFETALKGDLKPPPSRLPLLDRQGRAELRRELLDLRANDRNSKPPTEELVNNVLWFAYEGGFHENFEPYLAGIREGRVHNPAGWLQKFVNDAKASRSTGTCESAQQMVAKIGVKEPQENDESRKTYVSQEYVERAMEYAPTWEWKLIIALWRFGGLRRNEPLLLRWEDVLWDKQIIRVKSSKTKSDRIFPEIREPLSRVFEGTGNGSEWVIDRACPIRYRKTDRSGGLKNANLGTIFEKICRKAGLPEITMIGNNMRASAEKDMYSGKYPELRGRIDLIARILGHSAGGALKYYRRFSMDDFRELTESFGTGCAQQDEKPRTRDARQKTNPLFSSTRRKGLQSKIVTNTPYRSRTGVIGLRTRCPRPLDEGGKCKTDRILFPIALLSRWGTELVNKFQCLQTA